MAEENRKEEKEETQFDIKENNLLAQHSLRC